MSSPDDPDCKPADSPAPEETRAEGTTSPAPEEPARPGSSEPVPEEEDFASLLEQSLETQSFSVGESVEGEIVALDAEVVFIDIGGKGEATMDVAELENEAGDLEARVGDRVQALVVSTGGGIKLSRKLARAAANRAQLESAFHSRLPVEGRVEKVNKGGYEVRIGGQRGFCPMSQIDTGRSSEPQEHEGKVYSFRILEYKDGGKNLVVSRRAVLEDEEREKAREIMKTIVAGAVLQGRVVSVVGYGAFVDLGAGIQGLLHVSEMGWSRVADPAEAVQPDQEITVQVLKADEETRKISLSLKHLQADPWLKVGETYTVGQVQPGRITRLAGFGAFVELQPGVEALAHMSTFPQAKEGWQTGVQAGAEGMFRIESVDAERRRIGVSPVESRESPDQVAAGPTPVNHSGEPGSGGTDARRSPDTRAAGEPAEAFGSLADKLRAAIKKDGK